MSKKKVILFDMDGVLYHSMPHHAQAWKETTDGLGITSTEEDFYMLEGRTGSTTIDFLYERAGRGKVSDAEKKAIYARKANRFHELNDGHMMPGAKSLLEKIKAAGLSASVVTGSGQPALLAKLKLDYLGLIDSDKTVSAFDVKIGKPHPEPYLMGLAAWGITPGEAIVVENAPLGVESAKAAGIFTIAVNTGPLNDSILLNAGADHLYHSMQQLADCWSEAIFTC